MLPPGVDTTTATVPLAVAGGTVAVSWVPVALTTTLVACCWPNATVVGPARPCVNPLPLTVMVPPPWPIPCAGEMEVSVGTGSDCGVCTTSRLSGTDVAATGLDESVTCTVKLKTPSEVGEPERRPVWGSRLRPGGNWPCVLKV